MASKYSFEDLNSSLLNLKDKELEINTLLLKQEELTTLMFSAVQELAKTPYNGDKEYIADQTMDFYRQLTEINSRLKSTLETVLKLTPTGLELIKSFNKKS